MPTLTRFAAALAVCLGCATAPAAAQAPAKLTPERASALSATLDKRQKLDRLKDGKNDIERARKQCARLPAADPLLKAYASLCNADADANAGGRLYRRCRTNAGCRKAISKLRRGVDDVIDTGERLNTVLRTEVPDADCREALDLGRDELRGLEQVRSAFRLLAAAFRNGSERQFDRAQARLRRVRGIPTYTQLRDRFRRNCTNAENA